MKIGQIVIIYANYAIVVCIFVVVSLLEIYLKFQFTT